MSRRQSAMVPPPKPPTQLSSSLVIAEQAQLVGTELITLGSDTIIHPRAKLNSSFAPITVGRQCIICERSQIGLQSDPPDEAKYGVVLEDGVVVELGAVVEARRIGEGTVIEVNAKVGKGAMLGKHCKIGPLCEVTDGEVLPDYTVLYGDGMRRLDASGAEDMKIKNLANQIEVMRRLIPSNLAKFQ
ncbi:transferase hexapeptide domain protein [Drepanopeziza brunnea f. sp. 'multigermtubi' MB_m1]|uniref:Dynactin subunit 6 n=1 Tax=Marssonina brunnea f. sp. multigermtubi (strain MB_m1) TaxID=1072389 RepID=K1WPB1_MARBU|nr:transferase hexapeptide domain protein [Drepanopeziza brunnea f. sp. 'multigermtubi' MB_m1]EKD14811.1 transferase hexapeptide domain protein [Drepanopeziza brunnea f. sp. 'multigermtubi' MB_m1]